MDSAKALSLTVILVSLVGGFPAAAEEECLRYEPSEVTLTGTLTARTFAGPPNYESAEAGDTAETAIILVLSEPICVVADPASELNSERISGVGEVQLVLFGRETHSLLGQKVQVHGSLFTAHTGHHRTRVLLSVSGLRAA